MDSFEAHTNVFIVRIWLEPRESPAAKPEWRGVIEHVATHQRRYFKNMSVITEFAEPYLEQMGIYVGQRGRLRRWLKKIAS